MKIMIAKMVLCMGLLLVLLGESSPRLMAQGAGEPPTTGPQVAKSGDLMIAGGGMPPTGPQGTNSVGLMVASGGMPPTTGPRGAISIVS